LIGYPSKGRRRGCAEDHDNDGDRSHFCVAVLPVITPQSSGRRSFLHDDDQLRGVLLRGGVSLIVLVIKDDRSDGRGMIDPRSSFLLHFLLFAFGSDMP